MVLFISRTYGSYQEFCRSLFVLLSFFFGHCVVCPSIYGIWLPLWYFKLFFRNQVLVYAHTVILTISQCSTDNSLCWLVARRCVGVQCESVDTIVSKSTICVRLCVVIIYILFLQHQFVIHYFAEIKMCLTLPLSWSNRGRDRMVVGFTIMLRHRAPLARGPSSCQTNCLRWIKAYVAQFQVWRRSVSERFQTWACMPYCLCRPNGPK
jgi:hypothetical protein